MRKKTLFIFLIFSLNIIFAQNNAQFISQSGIPDTIMSGQQFNFSITMKNTGTTTWTDSNNYHIGSQNPQDNLFWGNTRFALPNDVAPNEEVTITGTATAPSNISPANFQWKMVQDGVEWFGETSELVQIIIPDAVVNNSEFISQTVPTSLNANEQFSVSLTFKNTGNTTWSENDLFRLGSKSPDNNLNWGENRMYLSNPVAPGEEITFTRNLTAPSVSGFYVFQWQMEIEGQGWLGELSAPIEIIITQNNSDSLLFSGNNFSVNNHIVATSFFTWYGVGQGQQSSPWVALYGRNTWTGSVEFWKRMIKEVMMANIDVLYVELIPYMEDKRGNFFIALSELRHKGWNVPKICPFLDPEITYTMLGFHADCSSEAGKDELVSHYIRFYNQYFATNADQYADDYIYTQDGHPVLDIWHIQLHIDNYDQLTRNDITSRLSAEFGANHPIFNNDIKMINNAYSPCFNFTDERIYQFEMQEYKIDKNWNGINSSLVKPGYWDQNVRNSNGFILHRDGGSHYSTAWENVNADASINRVYIESFNEYDEGSGIYAARTDTIYKKTDGGMNNTSNDVWSSTDNPYEYLNTTAIGAAQFNDDLQLNAKFIWNNIPTTINPGESFIATVIVRNEGNEQWNAANNFKLGENENIDNTLFGNARFLINDSTNEIPEYGGVFRGRVLSFDVEIIAPTTPGNYSTHWQMLQEGNAWFGDTLNINITVGSTKIYNIQNTNFSIFPNPAQTYLMVKTTNKNVQNIEIINITGKSVKKLNIITSKSKIDISNLEKGVYFIKLGNTTKKFVKE